MATTTRHTSSAEIQHYLTMGLSKRAIAKLVACAPTTLYTWLTHRLEPAEPRTCTQG